MNKRIKKKFAKRYRCKTYKKASFKRFIDTIEKHIGRSLTSTDIVYITYSKSGKSMKSVWLLSNCSIATNDVKKAIEMDCDEDLKRAYLQWSNVNQECANDIQHIEYEFTVPSFMTDYPVAEFYKHTLNQFSNIVKEVSDKWKN